MKITVRLLCLSLSLWICTASSNAGLLIVSRDTAFGYPEEENSTSRLYLDKDCIRVEMGENETDNVVIYRMDQRVFWILNTRDKTYVEMTEQDLKKMAVAMNEAMQKMQEAMKDLPPEQRAMMEEMMKGNPSAEKAKTTYKKVSSGEKVGDWTTDKYVAKSETEITEEVWTAQPEALGLKAEDFAGLNKMSEFFSEYFKDEDFYHPLILEGKAQPGDYSGLPLRIISYNKGMKTHQTEIQEIKREKFSASLFDLPAGYTKQEMEMEPEEE
jgi:hypothetical protein